MYLVLRCTRLRYRPVTWMYVVIAAILLIISYRLYDAIYNETRISDEFQVGRYLAEGVSLKPGMCVHPQFPVWPPLVVKYYQKPRPLTCSSAGENWVYVDKGMFFISSRAVQLHGRIKCKYTPLIRGDGDFNVAWGEPVTDMKSGSLLHTDFFGVQCSSMDGAHYSNIHAGTAPVPQPTPVYATQRALGLNIVIIGFDSVSRLAWMRVLPKTYDYLVGVLDVVVLEGYNIIGDGTPAALLPILTGQTEQELPEARRSQPDAEPVDGHPWIWKDLKKLGYITQYGEDDSSYNCFTYRMLGFDRPPTDHYFRPYFLKADEYHTRPMCAGSLPQHVNFLNYARQLFRTYPRRTRKFSFMFYSSLSHSSTDYLSLADDDVVDFLKFLAVQRHLENTLLIVMSDHGGRYSLARSSIQGKYEERNPFMSLRFPPSFEKNHPEAMKNLRTNGHRLSTPFDIHATLRDIVDYRAALRGDRGISLLSEIPDTRTCAQADIPPHWCACLNWTYADIGDTRVFAAAQALVETINSETKLHRAKCEELHLAEIVSAVRYAPDAHVLRFKQSDTDGYAPDMSDKMSNNIVLYQVTVTTEPGMARYEATVRRHIKEDMYRARIADISRINMYGKQPHCIMDELPHLRKYCFCRVQIE